MGLNPEITVESQIFYCILSILVFSFSFLAEKSNKSYIAAIVAGVMIFVAGFRSYTVGRDMTTYLKIFADPDRGDRYTKDPGFLMLVKILLKMCNSTTFLLLVFAVVTYGFIVYRLWEMRSLISFSCAVFSFYSFYYFESMNIMRQFCAIAIVFWGTRYLYRRSYTKYILCIIVAVILFHKSAVLGCLCLPVEILSWKELEKKQKVFLSVAFMSGIIAMPFMIAVLQREMVEYAHYFSSVSSNVGMRNIALLFIFIASLFLYTNKEKSRKNLFFVFINSNERNSYMMNSTRAYYIMGVLLTSLGYFFEFMARVGYYQIVFVFVYFGLLVKERRQFNRWIMMTMVIAIDLYVLLGFIFKINGSWHHPYHMIFL